MYHTLREKLSVKLEKLKIALDTPGALKAKLDGLYFEMYQIVYQLYSMGIRPRTFLDIGANRGMFSRCVHYVFPETRIYAFEPLHHCFLELLQLKRSIDKLECFNVAIGSEVGETVIHRSSYDYSSSLLEMGNLHKQAFPYTAQQEIEKVRVDTLDNILSQREIRRPLFMKVDVQGYEKQVLDGASIVLQSTDVILCEVSLRSLYEGQPLFHDVYTQLVATGFRLGGQFGELKHPLTREILQLDALFVRDS